MTTITVAKKNGQAAIASDTMTKWGAGKETATYVVNHQKILLVQDSYIAVTGPTSGKLVLKNYFGRTQKDVRLESVEEIFETWRAVHASLKTNYYLNAHGDTDDSFETTQMDVLIANSHGIFGVAAHRAVQEFSRFYAYGRGSEYALGAMYTAYEDSNKSAQEIAELGILAAAEFDDSTGLPLVSFVVTLTV